MPSPSPRPTFSDPEALQATEQGVALFDQSDWGRFEIVGDGSLDFLHNQSTNDLKDLPVARGGETIFITPTAGIVDLVSLYRTGADQALILTSPQRRKMVESTLCRFLVFLKGVELKDQALNTVKFRLVGPAAADLLHHLGWPDLTTSDPWCHHVVTLESSSLQVLVGSHPHQYTLICPAEWGDKLWDLMVNWGGIPASANVWETLCLGEGRPLPDHELTDTINPLEAGLWHAVSLEKGCYVGQEVLAKQVTYQRIRQTLWGIQLPVPTAVGTPVLRDNEKIGTVTRSSLMGDTALALAFIRSKAAPYPGMAVEIDQRPAQLVKLAYLSYPPGVGEVPEPVEPVEAVEL